MTDARLDLIAALRQRVLVELRAVLGASRRIALLDFPDHSNIGDSAIWCGEAALLRELGAWPPAYVCSLRSWDPHALRRRIGDGVILIHGGGNLGDLWPRHQQLKEEVVRLFPDRRIVMLPQSIHFESAAALARAQAIFDAHTDLHILVRDHRSLEIGRLSFRAESRLCPDAAFGLGPLSRPVPTRPVLWLARSDPESDPVNRPPPAAMLAVDWLDESGARLVRRLTRMVRSRRMPLRGRFAAALYTRMAGLRLARGIDLLGSAERVVTDRLHGHILCVLLGIPHLLLDNSYGKLQSFHRTWTSPCALVEWAHSGEEAYRYVTMTPAGLAS